MTPRRCPSVGLHKASRRAFVRWSVGGRDRTVYLGRWGTAEAADAYARFAEAWASGGPDAIPPPVPRVRPPPPPDRPLCRHCRERVAGRRGLCRSCHETPAVRELYPAGKPGRPRRSGGG